jgi:hypothetical protein
MNSLEPMGLAVLSILNPEQLHGLDFRFLLMTRGTTFNNSDTNNITTAHMNVNRTICCARDTQSQSSSNRGYKLIFKGDCVLTKFCNTRFLNQK